MPPLAAWSVVIVLRAPCAWDATLRCTNCSIPDDHGAQVTQPSPCGSYCRSTPLRVPWLRAWEGLVLGRARSGKPYSRRDIHGVCRLRMIQLGGAPRVAALPPMGERRSGRPSSPRGMTGRRGRAPAAVSSCPLLRRRPHGRATILAREPLPCAPRASATPIATHDPHGCGAGGRATALRKECATSRLPHASWWRIGPSQRMRAHACAVSPRTGRPRRRARPRGRSRQGDSQPPGRHQPCWHPWRSWGSRSRCPGDQR